MAHASRSRFPRRSAPGRRVSWSPGPSGQTGSISASSSNLFTVAVAATLDDLTLVRTRGELLVAMQIVGGAAQEGFTWAFGMCNVTENAAGIGVTAVPDPQTDVAWDGWFVHEQGSLISQGTAIDESSPTLSQRVPIDSKAMRKTHLTDVIVAVLGVTEIGAGSTMFASLTSRILDKLA